MSKRASIHASTLRARSLEDKAVAARLVEQHVLPGFAGNELTVPVDRSFPLDQAADAYEYFQQPGKFGKVVLTL
jgi:NADPH:quinone reductase-like Zn-dependent oxidoreductase